ncbi:MAG: hypothetical protein IJ785_05915 [Bacteroidales bacterium]|nr:hypothetical protein [Bacteroidales bacterium]
MKKRILFGAVTLLLLTASCTKEKHCRCAVLNSQTVRIITITKGDCHNFTTATYRDILDQLHIDTLVCTDYPFEADSLIVYPNEQEGGTEE